MDRRLRRQAALATLIAIVDVCNGSVDINTENIKRVFNDDYGNVRMDLGGSIEVGICDIPFEQIEDAINEWKVQHPYEFARAMATIKAMGR